MSDCKGNISISYRKKKKGILRVKANDFQNIPDTCFGLSCLFSFPLQSICGVLQQGRVPPQLTQACSGTHPTERWSHRHLSGLNAVTARVPTTPGKGCVLAEEPLTFDTHYLNVEPK